MTVNLRNTDTALVISASVIVAVAEASDPPPPAMVIVGGLVYPRPGLPTAMAVIDPPTMVTTPAVAWIALAVSGGGEMVTVGWIV